MAEKYLGRDVAAKMAFIEKGIWKSWNEAKSWCIAHNYSYGSSDSGDIIAIRKGEYNLPQKWDSINKEGRESVDGVMVSSDYREGAVYVYIFETTV